MKKLLGVLLGFCLIIPALMAADVSDINKQAWLSHIKEMNVMRRQIIEASKKANNSAEDMAAYNELMTRFETKQAAWDEYIAAVCQHSEFNERIFGVYRRGRNKRELPISFSARTREQVFLH